MHQTPKESPQTWGCCSSGEPEWLLDTLRFSQTIKGLVTARAKHPSSLHLYPMTNIIVSFTPMLAHGISKQYHTSPYPSDAPCCSLTPIYLHGCLCLPDFTRSTRPTSSPTFEAVTSITPWAFLPRAFTGLPCIWVLSRSITPSTCKCGEIQGTSRMRTYPKLPTLTQ